MERDEELRKRVARTRAPSTRELVGLAETLRRAGYDVTTHQCLAAQTLLLALAARGRLPEDPSGLRTLLAPVFCTSPEEQQSFPKLYDLWRQQLPSEPEPDDDEELLKETVETAESDQHGLGPEPPPGWRLFLRKLGQLLRTPAAYALTAALALLVLAFVYYRTRPLPPQTLFGKVVTKKNDRPVAKANVSLADASATTDESGYFFLLYQPTGETHTLSAAHECYGEARQEVSTSSPQEVTVAFAELTPCPTPTPRPTPTPQPSPGEGVGRGTLPGVAVQPAQPLPLLEWLRTRPDWGLVGALAVPFLFFGLWRVWRIFHRRQLEKRHAAKRQETEHLLLRGVERSIFHDKSLRRAAQELRRHRRTGAPVLDVGSTIDESARRGGLFTPVFGSRRAIPEYLVLVDRAGFDDQQAQFTDEVVGELDKDGVIIDQYYFQQDPRLCVRRHTPRNPRGLPVSLADLALRHSEHYLIIFSDGAGLIDRMTGRPQRWLEMFEVWPGRALLTPPSDWGEMEWALRETGFAVLPASKAGLDALAELIHLGSYRKKNQPPPSPPFPELLRGNAERWLEDVPPDPATLRRLLVQLRSFLGNRAFYWLCACAVYPSLLWELTLYFGRHVAWRRSPEDFTEQEEMLAALVRLPWLRYGVMPDWLRLRLLNALPRSQEAHIRRTLEDLLLTSLEPPSATPLTLEVVPETDEAAASTWGSFRRYVAGRWRHLKRRRDIFNFIEAEPERSPLREQVFLTFLSGSRLAVRYPQLMALRRAFFPEGQRIFGFRALPLFLLAALLSFGLLTGAWYADTRASTTDPVFGGGGDFGGGGAGDTFGAVTSETPSRYPYQPTSGETGGRYQFIVSGFNCTRNVPQGIELLAPPGSGVTLSPPAFDAAKCQLQSTLAVAEDAELGPVRLEMRGGGATLSFFEFFITPEEFPPTTLTLNPNVVRRCVNAPGYTNVLVDPRGRYDTTQFEYDYYLSSNNSTMAYNMYNYLEGRPLSDPAAVGRHMTFSID
ncbi:MAG TPA: hypothetical protein VGV38_13415, partial [Pyrinomonadaceae bacterium]|nr:hypothetical protein [Pyrinomonadaceae bacterium]